MENLIKEIKMWKTSDGTVFTSQEKAYEHQNSQAFNGKLPGFVKKHFPNYSESGQARVVEILQLGAKELIDLYTENQCFKKEK